MENYQDRKKLAWEGMFYSVKRIDLLIITISGAGIYICLETIKYFSDKGICGNPIIKIAGGLFLVAIVINFIGQFLGRTTNEQDYLMCQSIIDAGEKPTADQKKEIDNYDKKAALYTRLANLTNYISTILMLLGLGLIMVYFLFIF